MKNVLVFGDSLTWGSCPHTGGRHAPAQRWPDAMIEGRDDIHLVTEGLRGRTTAYARPSASADMSGVKALPILLHSHAPLDLIIIMLGTNDIYEGYELNQIRDGLARLIEIIRHHPWRLPVVCEPKIMLISPPPVTAAESTDVTPAMTEKSQALAAIIKTLAADNACAFFDAATVTRASAVDGFHLEAEDSRSLGLSIAAEFGRLL